MCTKMFCDATSDVVSCLDDLLRYVSPEFIVLRDGASEPGVSKEETMERLKPFCLCSINLADSFYGNKSWTIREDLDGSLTGLHGDWLILPREEPT